MFNALPFRNISAEILKHFFENLFHRPISKNRGNLEERNNLSILKKGVKIK